MNSPPNSPESYVRYHRTIVTSVEYPITATWSGENSTKGRTIVSFQYLTVVFSLVHFTFSLIFGRFSINRSQ